MINEEITLRKLEILLAFVETGHLGRTAERLQLSTVSVHRALHSLEQGLCCALFRHEGRNLKPLPSALALAEHARSALQQLNYGIQEARNVGGFHAPQLKLGAMYSLTVELIPRLISGLKTRRPDLDIALTLGSNTALLAQLAEQSLDALLMSLPESGLPAGLLAVPIFQDQVYLATPASQPAPHEPAELTDYRDASFVTLGSGFATAHNFEQAFAIAGFSPQVAMRVDDIFSLINLVAAGIGLSLLPGRVHSLLAGRVRLTPLAPRYQLQQTIGLILPANRERDPNLLALLAEARMLQTAGESLPSG
ncbi:LysR family transcriptional regulator [Vogesella sp. LIG4]|uniref:LysR family transcriptional regulator n=1 Tax=Vogesella sp. LIG4 TaxID=1192162 RepID=UPI00081F90E5|nr:LysR family transcriptional regulator [Vogesella sp. LIG4]SCK24459.1 LysR family transcriptional regulator, malonate utilization transcriptional regulator [Vogesella sp. LIG4]